MVNALRNPETPNEQAQLVAIFGQLADKVGEATARNLLQGAFALYDACQTAKALDVARSVLAHPEAYMMADDARERELAGLNELAVEYGHTAA